MTATLPRPYGDNTISPTLVPSYVSPGAITLLSDRLAPLASFAMRISPSPLGARQSVLVTKVTVGSTVQTNPTSWENGDTTAESVSVVVNQLANSFHITNDQMQQGHKSMAGPFSVAAAKNMSDAISDSWTILLKAVNFGTLSIGAAADFGPDSLATIYDKGRDFETINLILDHSYLSMLIPKDKTGISPSATKAYGFDGIYTQNRWTGADVGVVGFLCDPSALACVAGPPLPQPAGQFLDRRVVELSELKVPVEMSSWHNTATRTTWGALSVMFGAAVGESTKLVLLTSA